MTPVKPSLQAWTVAITYGILSYAVHKIGVLQGFYPRFFWFQLVTHFLSASAMALLLVTFGRTLRLQLRELVVFVVVCSAVGAVGWELVEYLGIFPALHWWGIDDSLLDLTVDTVGIGMVLALLRTRSHLVFSSGEAEPATEATEVTCAD